MLTNTSNKPASMAYLIYSLGFGLSLFFIIFYSGVKQWPLWQTVVLGSFVQFSYVMSKRLWRNQFGKTNRSAPAQTQAKLRLAGTIVSGYSGAFVICALWYSLGGLIC